MLYNQFVSYTGAIVLAFFTGLSTAYVLTRRYVFTETQRRHSEASWRFLVVNLAGLAQTWLVSVGLGDHILPSLGVELYAHDLAHMAGVATPVFTSFIAHRRWTFS